MQLLNKARCSLSPISWLFLDTLVFSSNRASYARRSRRKSSTTVTKRIWHSNHGRPRKARLFLLLFFFSMSLVGAF